MDFQKLAQKTFLQCNSGRLSLPPTECGRSAVPSLLGVPATDIVTDPDKPSSPPLSSSSCSHFSKLSSPLFSSQVNGDSAGKPTWTCSYKWHQNVCLCLLCVTDCINADLLPLAFLPCFTSRSRGVTDTIGGRPGSRKSVGKMRG